MLYKFLMLYTCIMLFSATSQAGDKAIMGTLLGAGLGAAIGHSADRTGGAGKGAVIGAIGGYVIGQQMDKNKKHSAEPPRNTSSYRCQNAIRDTDYASSLRNKGKKVFLLQNALRTCPSSAHIHNDLGVAYYQRGQQYDKKRARLELQEALRINPNYSVAQRNLRAM